MINGIVFDLDDTLYDYKSLNNPAIDMAVKFCAIQTKKSFEECKLAFDKARKETKELLGDVAACHNRLIYFQKTLENLDIRPVHIALDMYEEYWGYILSNMKLNDGAKELLDYCSNNGIRIGICTDLTAHIQHRKLRQLGIGHYVDALVSSEEAGSEKPDMRMFELIHRKMNTDKNKTWYVGDSIKKDVLGARKFGYTSFYYSDSLEDKNKEKAYNFMTLLDMIKNDRLG